MACRPDLALRAFGSGSWSHGSVAFAGREEVGGALPLPPAVRCSGICGKGTLPPPHHSQGAWALVQRLSLHCAAAEQQEVAKVAKPQCLPHSDPSWVVLAPSLGNVVDPRAKLFSNEGKHSPCTSNTLSHPVNCYKL